MTNGRHVVALAMILSLTASVQAQSWSRFLFGDTGSTTLIPVTVTDEFPRLQVTDAFVSGDWFTVRVLDGGSVVAEFECSEPTTIGDQIGGDYDAAFADERWSSGEVTLTARGDLTVEITVLASPITGGGGAGWRLTEADSPCRADLDMDGTLTIFDFLAFQNLFDAGDPIADFDGDGSLTIFDFLAFQNEFDLGCA